MKLMRMEGIATSGCSMTLVLRMRCVGVAGRFLDESIEGGVVSCGREEERAVLVTDWEDLDMAMFRNGRIYDDFDELQSAMSDMLRCKAILIKRVEAVPFGWKLVMHTDRRTGRGDCTSANEADEVQRKYRS